MKHRVIPALLLTAALAAPLAAGELIIPITGGVAADGTKYSTRVWVTNTGSVARRWTYSFIAPGADGTRAGSKSMTVAPGATVLVTNLAPAGQNGMLLVSGAPQLLVTPRLEAVGPGGGLRAATAGPVVGGVQVAAGDDTLHLHGLSHKPGGLITDLYVVNASRQTTQCEVGAFRVDGSRIAADSRVTLPPLSVRVFESSLALLGATNIDDARYAVSCDEAFYAYSRVYKPGSGELNVMMPSQPLGSDVVAGASTVEYPVVDDAALSPLEVESVTDEVVLADGTVQFRVDGQFLAARKGASFKAFDVPLQRHVAYKRATVEFDLYFHTWQTPLFHGITSLRRTGDRQSRVLYYGLIVRGSKGFKSIVDIGKDPRTGEGEILRSQTGPWRPRSNYHIRMDYDLIQRRVTLTVLRAGKVVHTLAGGINNLDLSTDGQRRVLLDFGQAGVGDGAYFPPNGSRYSNLRATFVPR